MSDLALGVREQEKKVLRSFKCECLWGRVTSEEGTGCSGGEPRGEKGQH